VIREIAQTHNVGASAFRVAPSASSSSSSSSTSAEPEHKAMNFKGYFVAYPLP
jgi:hypothetical protein